MKRSRHREPHKWQLLNTTDKYSADLKRGIWSEFENIVFSNIVRHLETNLMECDPDTLSHMLSTIIKHIHAPYSTLLLPQDAILRPKSTQQIASKLSHYYSERCLFEQISQQTTT
jgi:hypothetical protein